MEENEIFMDNTETFDDDVAIETDAEVIDSSDESSVKVLGPMQIAAGCATLIGIGAVGYKMLAPKVHNLKEAAKKKIVKFCTKNDEHYVIEEHVAEENEESEKETKK